MLKSAEISRDIRVARSKIVRKIWLMEKLAACPRLLRLIGGIGNRLAGFATEAIGHRDSKATYLPKANKMMENSDGVGYEGDAEVACFINYRNQIQNRATRGESEAWAMYDRQLELLPMLFNDESNNLRGMMNFGVSFAHVDSTLAEKFPELQFRGIDRSKYTEVLNQIEYGSVPNLKILTGDIFDELKNGDYANFALFHSRTAQLLPKPLINKLYNAAHDAGISHIVGFEPIGLSRETLEPYTFSLEDKESVWFRGSMFMHNFPGLLKSSGYEIKHWECLKTAHPQPDVRIIVFIAERCE